MRTRVTGYVVLLTVMCFTSSFWTVCRAQIPDSLSIAASDIVKDSLTDIREMPDEIQALTDSISNLLQALRQEQPGQPEEKRVSLRGLTVKQRDSVLVSKTELRRQSDFSPVPRKAVLLSMIIPGGGQIYNRKFWKLPIFYGGYIGCVYALTWNNQTYQGYMQAYIDIMDDDPETKSYMDYLPASYDAEANKEWLSNVLKNRKDMYRRYRDISIFCFAGVYLLSIIDAYVDAELSHFDVSRDLSLRVNPDVIDTRTASLGLNFSLSF